MAGSHVEDVSEQDQGRDPDPPTLSRKDKFCDAISSYEGRIWGMWTFWSNVVRRPWGIYVGRSRTFKKGCKARWFTPCHKRSSWNFKTRS